MIFDFVLPFITCSPLHLIILSLDKLIDQSCNQKAQYDQHHTHSAGIAVLVILEALCIQMSCQNFRPVIRPSLCHIKDQVKNFNEPIALKDIAVATIGLISGGVMYKIASVIG